MITNFEDHTIQVTQEELALIKVLVKGFRKHGKDDPIKEPAIVMAIREKYDRKFTGARLRKLCNIIRSTGLLPLIATSNGYYVSYDKEQVKKQIQSLQDRNAATDRAINGLKKFL